MYAGSAARWRAAVGVPLVAASLGAASLGAAGSASAAPSASPFCSQSTTLVKDLLNFGRLPKTNAAITAALSRVDRELAALGKAAPTRGDKATIATLRAEFAHLKTIILTDPDGSKPADATFVRGFAKTAAKQGLALGGEIKAACSK